MVFSGAVVAKVSPAMPSTILAAASRGFRNWIRVWLCALGVVAVVTSCGDDALHGVSGAEESASPNDDSDPSWVPDKPERRFVSEACDTAPISTVRWMSIQFDGDNGCAWGQDGNSPMRDAFITARVEETYSFELPENSLVCGIEFDFSVAEQEFWYDDHFLMHLNNVVLTSSFDFEPELGFGDLQLYDWEAIRGIPWLNLTEPRDIPYCLSDSGDPSRCSFPETDTAGLIEVDIPPATLQKIIAREPSRTSHVFGFVTTGDDNPPSDCSHFPLFFRVGVSYVTATPQ